MLEGTRPQSETRSASSFGLIIGALRNSCNKPLSSTAASEEIVMHKPFLLAPFLVLAVFTCSSDSTCAQQSCDTTQTHKVDTARAKEIYRRDCLVCHGANGDGRTDILKDRNLALPDWSDPNSLGGRADQQLFNVVRFGRGKMPAESAGRADDGEVRDLIHYIRTMARAEAVVSPGTGAANLHSQ
jgi:mono/diheme cytochrome c family protein